MRIPIAKEGLPFIFIPLALAVISLSAGFPWLTGILLALTLFILYFFRDPERHIPMDKEAILSPADGKLIQIRELPAGEALECPSICLSIFMSVLNVHVNRMPSQGKILKKTYNPGKYLPAFREKASLLNEQTSICMDTEGGPLRVTQIAGLIARRIVCKVQEGDIVPRGQRFGLIKFGSRVDLYLPQKNTHIMAHIGDRVRAGETVVACFHPFPSIS
jgi:phosphatidylserine decarboxylase